MIESLIYFGKNKCLYNTKYYTTYNRRTIRKSPHIICHHRNIKGIISKRHLEMLFGAKSIICIYGMYSMALTDEKNENANAN